jgi:hypothetical protein
MADNVVKFRKIEKKPDPKAPQQQRPPGKPPSFPGWLPWVVLVVLAVVLTAVSNPAAFGL